MSETPAPVAAPGQRNHQRTVLRGALHPGDIAIEGGVVSEIGTVAARSGDHSVECSNCVVTAGLVNTHHHLYQWLTRGRAASCDLFSWLTELYPVWAKLRPADVGVAALRGLAELALSGATTVFDHHYIVPSGDDSVFDEIAAAASMVGVRLYLSRGSMDLGESAGGLPPDDVVETTSAILESTSSVVKRLHDGDKVHVVVAPCSPFSVTTQLMEDSAELARSLGLRLHTHLAESLDEEKDSMARFGRRPLEVVEELGWTGDDVWFAHGIHLDDSEIGRLGSTGTGVAHCPSSNARLGAGICRVRDLLDAGAPVGLGVDGPASNDVGALFPEIRQALYFARLRRGVPSDLTPAEAMGLATTGSAACLGRPDLGRIDVGLPADLAVWPASDLADIEDSINGLVLGPDRQVRHLFVGGEQIVEDGALTAVDIGTVREEAAVAARRLWS